MKTRTLKFLVLLLFAMFGLPRASEAQQVQAELSQDYAAVGQPVRLNISVTGGRGAQVPQQLKIDGIDARFVGKSEQMQWQMGKGGVNSTATSIYSYLIVPLRQGDFTIPAIPVVVGGKTVKTSPLKLRVSGSHGTFRFCRRFPFRSARRASKQFRLLQRRKLLRARRKDLNQTRRKLPLGI